MICHANFFAHKATALFKDGKCITSLRLLDPHNFHTRLIAKVVTLAAKHNPIHNTIETPAHRFSKQKHWSYKRERLDLLDGK